MAEFHLFRLPVELRQQIYAHLIPEKDVAYPVSKVGITSVSHSPPSRNWLLVHPRLTEDLYEYFFSVATWKMVFSHAFNFFRVDPTLSNLEQWPHLRRIQKVKLVFFCDILLMRDYPSFGLENFCTEIQRRAERACTLLAKSSDLRFISIGWIDTTMTGHWKEKAEIIKPLRRFRDKVTFAMDTMEGPDDSERPVFIAALWNQLSNDSPPLQGTDTPKTLPTQAKLMSVSTHARHDSGHAHHEVVATGTEHQGTDIND